MTEKKDKKNDDLDIEKIAYRLIDRNGVDGLRTRLKATNYGSDGALYARIETFQSLLTDDLPKLIETVKRLLLLQKISSFALALIPLGALIWVCTGFLSIDENIMSVHDIPTLDSALNVAITAIAAAFGANQFLKDLIRRRVASKVNQLGDLAHLIDMHQLAKPNIERNVKRIIAELVFLIGKSGAAISSAIGDGYASLPAQELISQAEEIGGRIMSDI